MEFGLRSDIGKNRAGVTTVIESNVDLERQQEKLGSSSKVKAEAAGPLSRPSGWNNSESKLTEVSSDEEDSGWRGQGIIKEMVSTQMVN
jgi:hypothetical protein